VLAWYHTITPGPVTGTPREKLRSAASAGAAGTTAAAVLVDDHSLVVAEQVQHPNHGKRAGGVVVVASYHKSGFALSGDLMHILAKFNLVCPHSPRLEAIGALGPGSTVVRGA
jgi:hypothetical protein